jgi:hypothetical protein
VDSAAHDNSRAKMESVSVGVAALSSANDHI